MFDVTTFTTGFVATYGAAALVALWVASMCGLLAFAFYVLHGAHMTPKASRRPALPRSYRLGQSGRQEAQRDE